jgi:hypothetical protein
MQPEKRRRPEEDRSGAAGPVGEGQGTEVTSRRKQKEVERRILEAARRACSLFPLASIEDFEEPDFRIKTGAGGLGVEVTEIVRPKEENAFRPVETESFHEAVMQSAEEYYRASRAVPVNVFVYFSDEQRCERQDPEGWRRLTSDKKPGSKRDKMARSLAEFVKDRYVPGAGPGTFTQNLPFRQTLPTGFDHICISSLTPIVHWHSGEHGRMSLLDHEQLASTISRKNNLVPRYRANMPDCPIWLLIASGPSVSRGVPIPGSIDEWEFTFDFDKVLLFSGMDNRVFDIARR